jgi:hypothetical protein
MVVVLVWVLVGNRVKYFKTLPLVQRCETLHWFQFSLHGVRAQSSGKLLLLAYEQLCFWVTFSPFLMKELHHCDYTPKGRLMAGVKFEGTSGCARP